MMPGGRPTTYNQEIVNKICALLAQGQSLRTVCKGEDMPCIATVLTWIRVYPEFLSQYTRAKEESADALAEEILDIADDSFTVITGTDKSDNARVHAQRLRVDTRKWIMSKMKPKKYGEKLDLTSDGKVLPTPIYGGQSTKI